MPPPKCYAPVIKNLTTQEHTDRIITVSWLYHRNGSFKYCNGSRYFEVGYLSYATYEEAQNERAQPEVNYTLAGKRMNEFNISISERGRFYRFYVRTRLGEGSQGWTLPAVTQLQYFIPPGELLPPLSLPLPFSRPVRYIAVTFYGINLVDGPEVVQDQADLARRVGTLCFQPPALA